MAVWLLMEILWRSYVNIWAYLISKRELFFFLMGVGGVLSAGGGRGLSAVPYLNISRRIRIIYQLIIRISPIQSLLSLLRIHRHRRHFLLREAETLFLIRTFCTLQYLYFSRRNLREANLCEFRELLIFSWKFILRNFWKWRFAKVCLASIFRLSNSRKFIQSKFCDYFELFSYQLKFLKKHFLVQIRYYFCIFTCILNVIPKKNPGTFVFVIWIQYWRFSRIHS